MQPPPILLEPRTAAFLAHARVAHLATANRQGRPHVVPIVFVVLEGRLYSALDAKPKRVDARRLRRVRNVLENPEVAVVVDHYDEDWSRLGYVLLQGAARLLDAPEETAPALAALREKYPQYAAEPYTLTDAPLLVLEPQRVVTWGNLAVA